MKCDKCGSENRNGSKFCRSCGAPFENNQQINNKKSGISKWKIALVAVICCVIAIAGCLAYIIYFDNSPVEILQLNNKDTGNVYLNSYVASNIPESETVSAVCNATSQGVPIYKIGDGSGPVSLIVAGVHGDQLSSQVAALNLIDYLDGRKITGTVYVIPFAAPGATQDNTKFSDGMNLNTVADEAGTTSNDIVNFAKTNNISAVGDFHGTELGKNPGKTTIMCSQSPTYGSYQLANDMSVLALDTTMTYTVAGVAYDGAIEDECNLAGVPAVTPLVLSTHGQVDQNAVQSSTIQMLALLTANGNLNDDGYNRLANIDIDGF